MSNKLEVVDFFPTNFGDIPKQDNPAFCGDECLMVVGESQSKAIKNKHALVLHIVPSDIDSVTYIAKFWSHNSALKFCDTFDA